MPDFNQRCERACAAATAEGLRVMTQQHIRRHPDGRRSGATTS